ncbi:MAG: glutamate--cysteine ligase [bacterium]
MVFEQIAGQINNNRNEINEFIGKNLSKHPLPFYSSFDIRASSCKAAVVDANLFPAGFNNICPGGIRAAAQLVEQILLKRYPDKLRIIAVYSEDHTRNSYYFQNLHALHKLLSVAGFKTLLVTDNDYFKEDPASVKTADGDTIKLHRLKTKNSQLTAGEEDIDLLLSNNDFSNGVPEILKETETPLIPSPLVGWWNRSKHRHFEHAKKILVELAEILNIDPWLLYPETRFVSEVNLTNKSGFDKVAASIDEIIAHSKNKMREHNSDEPLAAFVKSAHGTYGMGVYSFDSGKEFMEMNRSRRDSMARRKGGGKNDSFIIQESIRTADRVDNLIAEPVIYCLEHQPIGGFLRTNKKRSDLENLNSRGVKFTAEDLCPMFIHDADKNKGTNISQARIEIYKLLATAATLACGREIAELNP